MGKSTISTGPFSIAFCMFTRGYPQQKCRGLSEYYVRNPPQNSLVNPSFFPSKNDIEKYIYKMVVLINKILDGFSISMPDTGMVKHTSI